MTLQVKSLVGVAVYRSKRSNTLVDTMPKPEKIRIGWISDPNGGEERIEVLRSPMSGQWVTREEYQREREAALIPGVVFATRRGHLPALPYHGATGWMYRGKGKSRVQCSVFDGKWVVCCRSQHTQMWG